tara:strand:+ start:932 stop:2149 length:1218 start_codon:yes stop_codon:yes gene_type:complete
MAKDKAIPVTTSTDEEIFEKAKESVLNINKGIELTAEEKEKIENPDSNELSEEESELSKDLQQDLTEFMKNKIEMEPGIGKIETTPTGIDLLDTILGGGFGRGTLSLIIGNPGTFKSALLAQLIAHNQKIHSGKLLSAYLDSENSMTLKRLAQLGVDTPTIKPYQDITIERVFKTIEAISAFKALKKITNIPSIVGWDSIANTPTEKDQASELDINAVIGLKARIMSIVLPRFIPRMADNNISLIAINQLREKLQMGMFPTQGDLKYLKDKEIPGGQALKFNAFHILHLRVKSELKYEQYGFNGVMVECRCIKNKLFTPNIAVDVLVNFNTGISNFWTNYNLLVTTKRIKASAWNTMAAYAEKKFRTKDAEEIYNSEPKFKKIFDEQVQDTIKMEFLDKYTNYTE